MKKILFVLLVLSSVSAMGYDLHDDPKYCGFVPRTTDGDIKRNTTMLKKFQQIHPCPSTRLTEGSCPGWSIDHVLPLAIGGCDTVTNMQWLPLKIKTCIDDWCKDRFERNIHNLPADILGFKPACCTNRLFVFPN